MDVKVRFRFNKITGEVEVFEVTDEGTTRLPEAEHNREHDRIAAELGNVIERNPRVVEVFPGSTQLAVEVVPKQLTDEISSSPEPHEQRERQTE